MTTTSEPDLHLLEPDIEFPPGDLLSEEPPLETELHLRQLILLIQCLEAWWSERNDFYAFGNLTVYYSPRQRKSEFFRGPDFFVVLGTERKPRKSWVVWEEEGRYPNVIVEILSDSTAEIDFPSETPCERGLKNKSIRRSGALLMTSGLTLTVSNLPDLNWCLASMNRCNRMKKAGYGAIN